MAKQGDGISERGKNTWRVFVSCGFNPDGTRNRKTITVHGTRREAELAKLREELKLKNQVRPSSVMTLTEWADRWLVEAERRKAPRTVHGYRLMLDSRILPALGKKQIDQIQPRDIASFLHQLANEPNQRREGETISGHTQLKHYRLLSLLLQEAIYAGLLTVNPAKMVKAPRMDRHRAQFYDAADVAALWQALQSESLMQRAIFTTALLLGLRRGELAALRWGDIDWNRNEVAIRRAAYKVRGHEQAVKAPKTASSVRIVPLPAALKDLLLRWREEQGGDDGDYLCADRSGGWLGIDSLTHWFGDIVTRHNLRPINLHGLRHTVATMLLDAGLPMRAVSEHLGHSQATTTANTYAHVTQGARARAAEVLNNVLPKGG